MLGLLPVAPAAGAPDGAEWETAADPMGCSSCHFDSPPPTAEALRIEGLPERIEPGRTYSLTLVLSDPALRNAGFMLSVTSQDDPAGELRAADAGTETQGALARQTRAGSVPMKPGSSRWQLDWTAPASLDSPVVFDLWANAGNDDLSPFGDTLHHRVWQIAPDSLPD
jgi:hypothetical protein